MIDLKSDAMKWSLLAAVACIVAAKLSRSGLTKGWELLRDAPPPRNPERDDVDWPEALLWGVCTGLVVGVMRVCARRGAAEVWKRATGRPLPDQEG